LEQFDPVEVEDAEEAVIQQQADPEPAGDVEHEDSEALDGDVAVDGAAEPFERVADLALQVGAVLLGEDRARRWVGHGCHIRSPWSFVIIPGSQAEPGTEGVMPSAITFASAIRRRAGRRR